MIDTLPIQNCLEDCFNLVVLFCRSGGDWSTTYAPSPIYMTSKMRSLYLEGYCYSVFDLTKRDRVQIQVRMLLFKFILCNRC